MTEYQTNAAPRLLLLKACSAIDKSSDCGPASATPLKSAAASWQFGFSTPRPCRVMCASLCIACMWPDLAATLK